MNLRAIAKKLPNPIKQGLKHAYGAIPVQYRYGKDFWETYHFLQESQWWSREKLEEYQMQQLSKLLHHAYENVPYYRKIFDERGLKPKNIQSFDDFRKLPNLTKDDFKVHFDEIVSKNVDLQHLPLSHTSGTSGKPLQFYTSPTIGQKEWAFILHQWSRVGYKPNDKRVEIRGTIKDAENLVEFDPGSKVLRFSPRIDNQEVAQYYLNRMNEFKAEFIHGYPSAIAFFAHTIKKYGLQVPFSVKAILFASETVYGWEREICKEVFQCRVFSHYGMAEQVALGAECEYSSHYHFLPQYAINEIDPETNEIIGTSLLNFINPFIRYRTTDIAANVTPICGKCGRAYFPVVERVEGRMEDYIVTYRGLISPATVTHPFKDFKTIRETQIYQKSTNLVILRLVPWLPKNQELYQTEVKTLCRDLQQILGEDIRIEVEEVDAIETAKSGKFKWIVSEVSKGVRETGLKNFI
jgi:phenylacetate-CoA ligase